MSATAPDVSDSEPFDADKSIAYLRSMGVEVETAEERAAKKCSSVVAASVASGGDDSGSPFTFVWIPAEPTKPVVELKGTAATGDVLPSLLAPAFADNASLDQDTVARETAARLKGMVMGGGDGKAIEAPSAQVLQSMSKGGVVEAYPLAPADEANGHRAVRMYIDEVGALRGRARNARAEDLANAAGLFGVSIHGDAYIGRSGFVGLPGRSESNVDFLAADLAHDSKWVVEARRAHGKMATEQGHGDTEHLASGGDGEGGTYAWTQTDEEVEVRVVKGIPEGKAAKKRIAVSYGKGGDALKVLVDSKSVLVVEKLFARVTPDECSWSVEAAKSGGDGGSVLVISMEKASARPWAELTLPGSALPGLSL